VRVALLDVLDEPAQGVAEVAVVDRQRAAAVRLGSPRPDRGIAFGDGRRSLRRRRARKRVARVAPPAAPADAPMNDAPPFVVAPVDGSRESCRRRRPRTRR
jgi:hypothetical protein